MEIKLINKTGIVLSWKFISVTSNYEAVKYKWSVLATKSNFENRLKLFNKISGLPKKKLDFNHEHLTISMVWLPNMNPCLQLPTTQLTYTATSLCAAYFCVYLRAIEGMAQIQLNRQTEKKWPCTDSHIHRPYACMGPNHRQITLIKQIINKRWKRFLGYTGNTFNKNLEIWNK